MNDKQLDSLLEGSIYDDDFSFERRNNISSQYMVDPKYAQYYDLGQCGVLNEDSDLHYDTDPTHWLKSMGWLGAAIAALLGLMFAALRKLYKLVKHEILAWVLKRYMKRIIELTDNGGTTKRFTFTKKDNRSSFKSYEESSERLALSHSLMTSKYLGLSEDGSPIYDLINKYLKK